MTAPPSLAPSTGDLLAGIHLLFDGNPLPMWIYDAETLRIVAVNDAAVARFGYSRKEFLAMSIMNIRSPEESARLRQRKVTLSASGLDHAGLWTYRCKNGRLLHADITKQPLSYLGRSCRLVIAVDITERLAAEEHLQRSETLLTMAGRLARVGGWTVDIPSMALYWSDAVATLHEEPAGFSPSVERAIAYYAPEHRGRIREVFERCASEGVPFDVELQIITARGRRRWVRAIGQAERDNSGQIVRLQGAFQEISERRQTEQAMQQSLARFHAITQATHDALWDWDLASDKLWWSEGFEQTFGYRPDAISAFIDSWTSCIHPDDLERVSAGIHAVIDGGGDAWSDEYRYQHAEGHWLDVLDRGCVIRGAEGEPVQMIGVMTDLTPIRAAERRAKSQLERLQLLQKITRAIGDRHDLRSIFEVVSGSIEQQLSAALCAVATYDPTSEEITVCSVGAGGEPLAQAIGLAEGARLSTDRNGLSLSIGGQLVYEPDTAAIDSQFSRRLAAGGLRSVVLAPLKVESKVFGLLIIAREAPQDFSSTDCEILSQLGEHVALAMHQTQLHGALQKAYEDLKLTQQAAMEQERLRALGQMASGIAHDINNAISPVALYTEALLETEPGISARTRKYLKTIQLAIDDVAETVARMRNFSRPREEGASRAPVPLNPLVQQAIELTQARWGDIELRSGVVITMEQQLDPALPQIVGVESELRDVFTNLIFNAVDAMPGGGTMTLRTRLEADASQHPTVLVEVMDTGIGMDEATRQRCLEPFFTTKGKRGSGLGLAMVYGTLQRHGGKIDIESSPDRGTTVRLRFPVSAVAAPSLPAPTEDGDAAVARPLHLLLVDDDPVLLRSLADTLGEQGHRVETAPGGQQGIDTFGAALHEGRPFDAVITDLGMPHVDGRQVAQAIKAASPTTLVLMLTGWGRRMNEQGELPPHVDQLISKPPRIAELRRALAPLEKA